MEVWREAGAGRPAAGASGRASRAAALAVLAAIIACSVALSGCNGGDGNGLNVIILMVDTLRADHLGYHGYSRDTSPNLDRFAGKSAVFMANYSQASRTEPSVASLLTGLNVRSHGVRNPLTHWDAKGVLVEENVTLAEIVAEAGYRCRGIVANPNVYPQFGFAQGFQEYTPVPMFTEAGAINSEAVRWIEAGGDTPFFLYLHYMEPHSPYDTPPPPDRVFVDRGYRGPLTGAHAELDAILAGRLPVDEADKRHLAALYDQEIASFDRELGRLLTYLESRGRLEDTVVVFVSDHGEEFFEHGGVLHGYTVYNEQLHVPLVIHAPGLAPCRVDAVTRNIDVLPTVLGLLDLEVPDGVQGADLRPLAGGKDEALRSVLSEAQIRAVRGVKSFGFQSGQWKYIETAVPDTAPKELYDLAADPGERHNLYALRPDMAQRIAGAAHDVLRLFPERETRAVPLDPDMLEKMRQMGYTGSRNE